MRILEAFGEPISFGGQEAYVMTALQSMELSGMDIDLFTPYYCDNGSFKEFIERNGGKVFSFGLPFAPGSSRRNIIGVMSDFLKENHYDIVHIHSGSVSVLAYEAMAARRAGTERVIVHSHCSGVSESLKHRLVKAYASLFLRRYATDFCACSVESAKWKYPDDIVRDKTVVLKNGVDTAKFAFSPETRAEVRENYGIKNDTLVVGHVGRFTYEKNQLFLIRLFAELKSKKADSKLLLIGGGEKLEEAKALAAELGIGDDVIFAGVVENVQDYLQAFDVFVFPSLYEGLGIVSIEAQAAGLPVVASDSVPRDTELTENVRFLSLEADADEWCRAILGFEDCQRNATAEKIKARGFDIKDTANDLKKLYMKRQQH